MPDITTGISAGISLFAVNEGAKSAGDSSDFQREQLELEKERDAFNRKQIEQGNEWTREDRDDFLGRRERERGLLDPVQQGVVDLAQEGPDYEGAASRSDADVAQAYGLQRDMESRRRSRYGINVASGSAASESRRFGNEQALAQVGGRQRSRLIEDDKDWARKLAALGTGNIRNAAPNASLQQLGVSGASGVLGGMASSAGADSAAAFSLFGKTAQDALDSYGRYNSSANPVAAGAGASSTYGVGTFRNNPGGGYTGGF